MSTYSFTLFVSGQTPRSERAIANLRRLCEETLAAPYRIEIVDVMEQPELAERERVLTTPTLIKNEPLPTRRVTGDLADRQQLIFALGLGSPLAGPDAQAPPPSQHQHDGRGTQRP
ncbi:MAG: circadian clock KaiB family protein [Longimicrobiales bacterium]